jgi:hypothetical protein
MKNEPNITHIPYLNSGSAPYNWALVDHGTYVNPSIMKVKKQQTIL